MIGFLLAEQLDLRLLFSLFANARQTVPAFCVSRLIFDLHKRVNFRLCIDRGRGATRFLLLGLETLERGLVEQQIVELHPNENRQWNEEEAAKDYDEEVEGILQILQRLLRTGVEPRKHGIVKILVGFSEVQDHCRNHCQQVAPHRQNVQNKVLVVFAAHAVVDPRAVVWNGERCI